MNKALRWRVRHGRESRRVDVRIGSRVHVLHCDLREGSRLGSHYLRRRPRFGQLGILVNNAWVRAGGGGGVGAGGGGGFLVFGGAPDKDNLFMRMKTRRDEVIAINLTSAFFVRARSEI